MTKRSIRHESGSGLPLEDSAQAFTGSVVAPDHQGIVRATQSTRFESMEVLGLREDVRRLNEELTLLKTTHAATQQRLHRFDTETGLPTRGQLLERSAAEFRRAKRYNHHVSVLMVAVRGLETIEAQHGLETAAAIFCGVAQVCESVSRTGIDLLGVFDHRVIAIVLPETRLSGSLALGDRLKEVAGREPFQVNQHQVRPALNVAADAVLKDDEGMQACLTRAFNAINATQY